MRRTTLCAILALSALGLAARASAEMPRKDTLPDLWSVDEQLQGDKFKDFRSLKGNVVIVNCFQHDTADVDKRMETIWQEHKGKGVVVIGVTHESREMAKEYIAKTKCTYTILRSTEMPQNWGLKYVPSVCVIAPSGKVATWAPQWGPDDSKILTDLLKAIKPEDYAP